MSFLCKSIKKKNSEPRVKLIAIAKDESAYLAEWIYHHHYFGVDSFDIHVNNTADNTIEVLNKLKERFDINIIDSNGLYQQYGVHFQTQAYEMSLKELNKKEFTHVGFLDVDEFWTPADFSKSVKDILVKNNQFDSLIFSWVIHVDEYEFSRCFRPTIKVVNDHHVKCFAKTSSSFKTTIHNIVGESLDYGDCDGVSVRFSDETNSKLESIPKVLPNAFILHRAYRSELEYVSALARGRPNGSRFKNNRKGYYVPNEKFYDFVINGDALKRYYLGLDSIFHDLELDPLIIQAQKYIKDRYRIVLELATDETTELEKQQLVKAFSNIKIPEVNIIKNKLTHELSDKRESNMQRRKHIDAIRDAAIFFDKVDDGDVAYVLMELAHKLRPEGKFIEKKYKEFSQKRSIDD